jgi:ribosome maturation factor RimP
LSITESVLNKFLETIVNIPLQIYSLDLKSARGHFLIEICLDNLNDPRGSVSIKDCENVSKLLGEFLEESYSDENYTLQVSSAGAERELRLPGDLGRFKNVPVKIDFMQNGKKISKPFTILNFDGKIVTLSALEKKDMKAFGKNFELKVEDISKGNLFLKI